MRIGHASIMLAFSFFALPAHAKPTPEFQASVANPVDTQARASGRGYARSERREVVSASRKPNAALAPSTPRGVGYDRGTIVVHPAGCPGSLFCGCGASVEAFGHPVRGLYLANAWLRFPRAAPAPGMAVVWPGRHVAIIRQNTRPGFAVLYDANSGGGLTRVHEVRSAGLVVVDPHGSSVEERRPSHRRRYATR